MKLHHVALTVKDLTTSIYFYENFFGFKEKMRFHRDDKNATAVFLEGENAMLELWQFDITKVGAREDLSITGIKHLAFSHEDPETFRTQLLEKEIECESLKIGSSGGIYFFLADPDLNQIEIYKPK